MTNDPATILAIDPSACDCGFALLCGDCRAVERLHSGTWHPSKARTAEDRFEQLAMFVAAIVQTNKVENVAVEIPDGGERFFRRPDGSRAQIKGKSERTYAQAVGVCRAAARVAGATVWATGVTTWKGRSRKSATEIAVRAITGHTPADDNESDAIGLGIWWLNVRPDRQAVPTRAAVEALLRK